MIANYLIYLNTLTKEEKIEQIFMFIVFFLILLIIGLFLTLLKSNLFRTKGHN